VRWREEFGPRFTIIVDTEEEFDWSASFARAGHAVTAMSALPEAAGRFRDMGAALNMVVDYPVIADPAAVDCLHAVVSDGRSEVGTQLHPWVNPPFDEPLTHPNSFAGNLPAQTEAAKLDALTRAIANAMGRAPRLYRAGRYGLGPNTFALLGERGYRIDSSMRARYDYSAEAGPDFRAIGNDAFWTGAGGTILEVPFSTVFTGRLRGSGPMIDRVAARVPRGRGLLSRTGMVSRVSLTPEGMPLAEAREAVRVALGEGLRLLNFAFHSPSLVPGHTPYVRDASDLKRFWTWWDLILGDLARAGVDYATLDDILAGAAPSLA